MNIILIIFAMLFLLVGVTTVLMSLGVLPVAGPLDAKKGVLKYLGLALVAIALLLFAKGMFGGKPPAKLSIEPNLDRIVNRINVRAPHELTANVMLVKAHHNGTMLTLEHEVKGMDVSNINDDDFKKLLVVLAKKEQCERSTKRFLIPQVPTQRVYTLPDGRKFDPVIVACK